MNPENPIPAIATRRTPSAKTLIGLGIFVVLVAVGSYFLGTKKQTSVSSVASHSYGVQPTKAYDQTSSWETYTSIKYGYSIKYPQKLKLSVYNDADTNRENAVFHTANFDPDPNLPREKWDANLNAIQNAIIIGVSVFDRPLSELPLGNRTEQGIDYITDWKEVIIGGVTGHYFQTHQCAPACSIIADLPFHTTQTLQIAMTTPGGDEKLFSTMLSTFKFTNAEQADAITNWKSYADSSIHFSLKYPNDWTLTELKDDGVVDGVDLKGPEGTIHAAWGTGFGGGCDPKDTEPFTFFGSSRSICHFLRDDGSESWNQLSENLGDQKSFGAYAVANAPYLTNRDTILQILSTFKLSK